MFPAWLPQATLICTVLGPVSHCLFWMRHEFDEDLYKYTPLAALSQPTALLALHYLGLTWLSSILTLSILQTAYATATFLSIAVYRLHFHPACRFPGPFWAGLWSFWRIKAFKDSGDKAYEVFHQLHQRYGDVVRIGPRQISINHVDAIAPIYGSGSKYGLPRDVHATLQDDRDMVSLRDPAEHNVRRKIWEKGLNTRVIQNYIPRMEALVDLFVSKLAAYNGQPVVINDWIHYITFDVVGDLIFGQSYNQIRDGRLHPAIYTIQEFMSFIVGAIQVPWLANIVRHIPGLPDPMTKLHDYAEEVLKERERTEPEHPDVLSYIMDKGMSAEARWPMPRSHLLDDTETLQVKELYPSLTAADRRQIAGSDTSYSALVHLCFYFAKYPDYQTALRTEVSSVLPSALAQISWSKLSALPLLDAVINETLRLHPPAPQGFTRETPKDQPFTQVGPFSVPGEMMLSIPTYTIQRDPRYFEQPNAWIPERWTTKPEMIKDKRAWVPFGVGPTGCIGKGLAMMEMKVFLAKILLAFDVDFAPGVDEVVWNKGKKDYFTMQLPDLRMCLKPREKQ